MHTHARTQMCYICRRELRKSGISGNAQAIEEILELPRQLWKTQAFLEMLRQMGEFLNFFLQTFNSGKQQSNKKSTLKAKLN